MSQPSDSLEYRVSNYLDTDDFHESIREMYRGSSSVRSSEEFRTLRNEIKSLIDDERSIRVNQTSGATSREDAQKELNILKYQYVALAANIDKLVHEQAPESIDGAPPISGASFELPLTISAALKDINPERLMGRQNLKAIGWLRRGLVASQAVCRIGYLKHGIRAPYFFGTGFLVAGEWMVTAAHNFMLPNDKRPREEYLRRSVIQFGYDDEYIDLPDDDVCQYKIDMSSVVYPNDPSIDCIVARLKRDPDHSRTNHEVSHWGHLDIEPAAMGKIPRDVVLQNDFVPIIQHPNGEPKQIAVTSNEVLGVEDGRIWYTTDTERGSSGAPVCNERWCVVAVHLGVSKKGMRLKSLRHQLYPNVGLPIRRAVFDKNLRTAFFEKSE